MSEFNNNRLFREAFDLSSGDGEKEIVPETNSGGFSEINITSQSAIEVIYKVWHGLVGGTWLTYDEITIPAGAVGEKYHVSLGPSAIKVTASTDAGSPTGVKADINLKGAR